MPDLPCLIYADQPSVFAAYHAAQMQGTTIGRDVSILGMGFIPADMPVWPRIRGYRYDLRDMVQQLASCMIGGLEGKAEGPRHAQLGYRWMAGDRCALA